MQGDPSELGPRTAWFRLKVPVIAGEEPTPLQRLLVAADFPNGISNEIDWREWLFINPDLTVYIEREPRGEWIALQARTRMLEGEAALAEAVLFDTEGRVGRSLQSLSSRGAEGQAAGGRGPTHPRRHWSLQPERLDADVVLLGVAAVDPVRERLDDRQQRRVRAHERRCVRRVVQADAGQPRYL